MPTGRNQQGRGNNQGRNQNQGRNPNSNQSWNPNQNSNQGSNPSQNPNQGSNPATPAGRANQNAPTGDEIVSPSVNPTPPALPRRQGGGRGLPPFYTRPLLSRNSMGGPWSNVDTSRGRLRGVRRENKRKSSESDSSSSGRSKRMSENLLRKYVLFLYQLGMLSIYIIYANTTCCHENGCI